MSTIPGAQGTLDFDGPAYDPTFDRARLTGQALRVWRCMADGRWRTLQEIADSTGDPESSVSAQLRHLRKKRFGEHTVLKRTRGERNRMDQLPRQVSGLIPASSTAGTESTGAYRLNPSFSLWLMGYPIAWARCAARVTLSSRRSRRCLLGL